MESRRSGWVVLTLLSVACTAIDPDQIGPALDAGMDGAADASRPDAHVDGGTERDAGVDGGAELDAALDSGVELDGGAEQDGGADGGPPPAIVYLSMGGDDARAGRTVGEALRTLAHAIEVAAACEPAPCAVHAEEGFYDGPVELRSGVDLMGGFTDGFTATGGRSVVRREANSGFVHTVRAVDVENVRISRFDLQGADLSSLPAAASGSVVTLWLQRSHVRLEQVTLHGGNGRRGLDGASGSSGASRGTTGCANRGDGRRQTSGCQGALGGTNGQTSARIRSGTRSTGAGGGHSACSTDHCPIGGAPGCSDGGDASTGGHGTAGPNAMWGAHEGWGTLSSGGFVPSSGADGGEGGDGGGGGGGGEGGDRYAPWCLCSHGVGQGGAGGHGGRGGCGGDGGTGGRGGGASFVVIVDVGTLTFGEGVTLIGGAGGQGGAGGAGGAGQGGFTGSGGSGGDADNCNGEHIGGCRGGRGGNGGNGAAGGRGAGGDGGPSVLVARVGGGSIVGSPTFVPGTGGARPPGDTSGALVGPTSNVRTY